MEAMVKKVCGLDYVFVHPFQFWGCEKLAKTESNRVRTALKHLVQDVRGAILAMYYIVERLFEEDEGDNMMPLLYQFLFMHLDIKTKDTRNFSIAREPILCDNDHDGDRYTHPIRAVYYLWDTSIYYVRAQDYLPRSNYLPNPEERFIHRKNIAPDTLDNKVALNWNQHKCSRSTPHPRIAINDPDKWCQRCGYNFKEETDKPHPDCGNKPDCIYPLCENPQTHNILVCPTLHGICNICKRRGHQALHHRPHRDYPKMSLMTLEYLFYHWMAHGKFSSTVLFELSRLRRTEIKSKHWKWNVMNVERFQSQRSFKIIGIPYNKPTVETRYERKVEGYDAADEYRIEKREAILESIRAARRRERWVKGHTSSKKRKSEVSVVSHSQESEDYEPPTKSVYSPSRHEDEIMEPISTHLEDITTTDSEVREPETKESVHSNGMECSTTGFTMPIPAPIPSRWKHRWLASSSPWNQKYKHRWKV